MHSFQLTVCVLSLCLLLVKSQNGRDCWDEQCCEGETSFDNLGLHGFVPHRSQIQKSPPRPCNNDGNTCDGDHPVRANSCGANYCCPKPNAGFLACSENDFNGNCKTYDMNERECVNLDDNDSINSINTFDGCFRIYENANCEGKTTKMSPKTGGHNDLGSIGFGNSVTSVGKCWKFDECEESRSKRQTKKRKLCDFKDELTIGFIPWLSRDTSNLPEGGPVQYYQIGPGGRTETMDAIVKKVHLKTGSEPSDKAREKTREFGHPLYQDHAGHILADQLGGSGDDLRNIFPQTPNYNTGDWRVQVENLVRDIVIEDGACHYTVNLIYENTDDRRPIRIVYTIRRSGSEDVNLINDFTNEVNPEKAMPWPSKRPRTQRPRTQRPKTQQNTQPRTQQQNKLMQQQQNTPRQQQQNTPRQQQQNTPRQQQQNTPRQQQQNTPRQQQQNTPRQQQQNTPRQQQQNTPGPRPQQQNPQRPNTNQGNTQRPLVWTQPQTPQSNQQQGLRSGLLLLLQDPNRIIPASTRGQIERLLSNPSIITTPTLNKINQLLNRNGPPQNQDIPLQNLRPPTDSTIQQQQQPGSARQHIEDARRQQDIQRQRQFQQERINQANQNGQTLRQRPRPQSQGTQPGTSRQPIEQIFRPNVQQQLGQQQQPLRELQPPLRQQPLRQLQQPLLQQQQPLRQQQQPLRQQQQPLRQQQQPLRQQQQSLRQQQQPLRQQQQPLRQQQQPLRQQQQQLGQQQQPLRELQPPLRQQPLRQLQQPLLQQQQPPRQQQQPLRQQQQPLRQQQQPFRQQQNPLQQQQLQQLQQQQQRPDTQPGTSRQPIEQIFRPNFQQ